jgi:hypothetical protein
MGRESATSCGVDVSKKRLDVALRPTEQYLAFENDARGISKLVKNVKGWTSAMTGSCAFTAPMRLKCGLGAEEWRHDYNEFRPHSSLGKLAPREFAERQKINPPSQLSVA